MFLSLPSSSSLFLIFSLFFLLHPPSVAVNEPCYRLTGNGNYTDYNGTYYQPRYQLCGKRNYTANSTYETNLNLLLPSLVSNASLPGGYFTTMIGQSPNQVYGLAICRGDVNASRCHSCLVTASQDIVRLCPYKIEAVVADDPCVILYTNMWELPPIKESDGAAMWTCKNITTDRHLFEKLRNELLSAIADWAAYNTTMKFATGEVNFTTGSPTIYGLVQCTPDMWASQCRQCLQDTIEEIPTTLHWAQGGWILQMRCFLRYELSTFFDGTPMIQLGSREKGNKKNVTGMVLTIAIPLVASSLLICITCISFWMRRKPAKNLLYKDIPLEEITHAESLLIDLSVLRSATANFSEENKLGAGGFGAVYRGTLPNGQEFAAKRLSTTSRQGLAELKNELVLVAKLRHKNLVRLLGVCLEEQEKLIVYEYVPNRSLDTILFDRIRHEQLHWERRHKIIHGIARGLLYLHEDSQLKVIHRDLKAGNILLDADMNPKISDFGLARLFSADRSHSITTRVVGTFGYMAPEYVMHGQFSIKSDVYSFGVLILEIITGRKNSGFSNSESGKYLLAYIWEQWSKGTVLEILDPCLCNNCPTTEVLRCMQIGLLCVQENPSDRPDMSTVVMMLNNDAVSLLAPSSPAFYIGHCVIYSYANSNEFDLCGGIRNQYLDRLIPMSLNEVSMTELAPR
ncbi:cysteine-rich receptor-like protein kinase 10 isoform X2 [Elaeis guineensis]|uniref:cysteine-rich receptor-like protein kinase 10 isoform X2 n=1 Tax=Elaeis guineensis var. tenera TaxID=51953 RepID=UPI003C6CD032